MFFHLSFIHYRGASRYRGQARLLAGTAPVQLGLCVSLATGAYQQDEGEPAEATADRYAAARFGHVRRCNRTIEWIVKYESQSIDPEQLYRDCHFFFRKFPEIHDIRIR